jgi:DNA-binding MarR family transcriptional regulator
VAAGLVCREAEPGDRRVVRLHLTEAGQAAVTRADEAYAAWLDDLLEYTGRKDEVLASLQLLDESMTERRRIRKAAEDTSAGQR